MFQSNAVAVILKVLLLFTLVRRAEEDLKYCFQNSNKRTATCTTRFLKLNRYIGKNILIVSMTKYVFTLQKQKKIEIVYRTRTMANRTLVCL